MKNFPHQYNDIGKIRAALTALEALQSAGADVGDDGVFGYDLARKGVYRFRRLVTTLDERIVEEQQKPSSSQGARTAARETRRTLCSLGFVSDGPSWNPTAQGRELLATTPGSLAERAVWQRALLQLSVTDEEGSASHPVPILLRLIAQHGGVSHRDSSLMLEPEDDSDGEFVRTSALLGLTDNVLTTRIATSSYQLGNARKILPSFAQQAGLIETDEQGNYVLTESGESALGEGTAEPAAGRERHAQGSRSGRPSPQRRIGRGTRGRGSTSPITDDWSTLSRSEQIALQLRLRERTERHEGVVDALAEALRDGYQDFEDQRSFDLVGVTEDGAEVHLFEVKTLETDARMQARRAIGQLAEYEYYRVRSNWEGAEIRRYVVFDGAIPEDLAEFLQTEGIGAIVLAEDSVRAVNDRGNDAPLRFTD